MLLLPTKKQWERWSLPNKLTAISAYIGIIAIILSIIFFLIPFSSYDTSPKPDFILYPYGWQAPENISLPSNISVNGKETEMILGIQNIGQTSGFYKFKIFVENLTVEEFIFRGRTGEPIIYESVKIPPSSTHEYHFYFKPEENNIENMPSKANIGIDFIYFEESHNYPRRFRATRHYNFDNNLKQYIKTGEDIISDVDFS